MRKLVYELDRDDRIQRVDASWAAFARENGAPQLAAGVVGSSIWDWITGPEVEHLYRLLLARIRGARGSARIPFRCDSPETRRFMELEIAALPDGGLRFRSWLTRAEPRAPVALLDPRADRSERFVGICSWCKRVRARPEVWLEIEHAASSLRLLEGQPPQITHTICGDCQALFRDSG